MPDHQLEVGRTKLPLNSYDLLGYLGPGTTLLASVFLFEFWARERLHLSIVAPVYSIVFNLWPSMSGPYDWIFAVTFFLFLLAGAYVLGHLVSSVSSFLVDRLFIYKGYGYPYERLLNLTEAPKTRLGLSRAFHRGMLLWVNLYFVVRIAYFFSPKRILVTLAHVIGYYVVAIIIVKLLYHFRAIAALFGRTSFLSRIRSGAGAAFRFWMSRVHASLYEACARPLSLILGTKEPFNTYFIQRFQTLFMNRFLLDYKEAGTNNFWLPYAYVLQNSPVLGALISNWLRLYSFARNLSIAFYLAFLYCFASFSVQPRLTRPEVPRPLALLAVAFFLLSGHFLLRYVYLNVKYYTKFTFRAFVVLGDPPPPNATPHTPPPSPSGPGA